MIAHDKRFTCPSCGEALSMTPEYVGYSIACCIDIGDEGEQTGPHAWGPTTATCEEAWNEMIEELDFKKEQQT